MPQTIDAAQRYLRAPRLPKASPVVVLHVRADNDTSGNPRRCFAVLSQTGRLVETIDEGYGGEGELRARWPWFDHTAAARLGLTVAYSVTIFAAPAEYRRWIKAGDYPDTESPDVIALRRLGTRCARWSAVRDTLVTVRRSMAAHEHRELVAAHEGRPNNYGDTSAAVVYHRHPADGGDAVSDHLRRAMTALVRAGMVERTDSPPTAEMFLERHPDASQNRARDRAAFFSRSVGQYRRTDSTPDLY